MGWEYKHFMLISAVSSEQAEVLIIGIKSGKLVQREVLPVRICIFDSLRADIPIAGTMAEPAQTANRPSLHNLPSQAR